MMKIVDFWFISDDLKTKPMSQRRLPPSFWDCHYIQRYFHHNSSHFSPHNPHTNFTSTNFVPHTNDFYAMGSFPHGMTSLSDQWMTRYHSTAHAHAQHTYPVLHDLTSSFAAANRLSAHTTPAFNPFARAAAKLSGSSCFSPQFPPYDFKHGGSLQNGSDFWNSSTQTRFNAAAHAYDAMPDPFMTSHHNQDAYSSLYSGALTAS